MGSIFPSGIEVADGVLNDDFVAGLVAGVLGTSDGGALAVELDWIDENGGLWWRIDGGFQRIDDFGAQPDGLKGLEFLHSAAVGAFGAAGVEIKALEALGHIGAQQRVATLAEVMELGIDFSAAAAAEAPRGMGVLGEEVEFDGADGLEGRLEIVDEVGKLLFLAFDDDEVLGAEAVAGAVAGGGGFAFGGARASGAAGVGLIGVDLGGGGNGVSPFGGSEK